MASKRPTKGTTKSVSVHKKTKSVAEASASATASSTTQKQARSAGQEVPGRARTIIYVHGIGNKPPADTLKCQWDEALFGFNLGERSRLSYWVNRVFYPEPIKATCKSADSTQDLALEESGRLGVRAVADPGHGIEPLLPEEVSSQHERQVLERIAEQSGANEELAQKINAASFGARVLPLPKPIRDFISRRITKAFLKDVHEFLFVKERRDVMRESVLSRLRTGGGPFIVIGHSQGSMVAYDALLSIAASEGIEIDLFVTIGSPLGLQEVQDQLKKITNQKKLAVPRVKRWVNVADPLDPVCADKFLRGDYAATNNVGVEDFLRINPDSPRDPHSGSGYLRLADVRAAVRDAIDRNLFQRIAPFVITRDLVSQMERAPEEERHSVLIELRDEWDASRSRSADVVRDAVVKWIEQAMRQVRPKPTDEVVDLEALSGYVSANLTRSEVERMSAELRLDSVYRVFKNARKRALLDHSINVLQCSTAHRGYDSCGQDITWAVLDTGIDPLHPHFNHGTPTSNIGRVFDCLTSGPIREWDGKKTSKVGVDFNGHGTHVAGVVAGGIADLGIIGIAPAVRLNSYKVLDDNGRGSDAKIIKALDHIYELNRNSSSLVVHGINLSLGGPFDPEAFGCGDTPICKQLRRLWRQGVVVVLAAGNEGYLELQQGDEMIGINADLSIGDPANLEEAIAVGSVHKSKPHTYGISYFSSRGPTADGRCKPDLVAPGERIVSCRTGANPKIKTRDNLYVAMSGTSMAAPHVSGLIACFLSARKEFIGYPDRVKELLLRCSTDLKRDRMHQGAGMPNLVKMLMET